MTSANPSDSEEGEAEELPAVKELADLSERELDRMETLVQSLLAITKLDAGSIVMEKDTENVADLLRDVELQFAHRARQEHKEIVLSGPDEVFLFCDRDWLEAIGNIVKTRSITPGKAMRFVSSGKPSPLDFSELFYGTVIFCKRPHPMAIQRKYLFCTDCPTSPYSALASCRIPDESRGCYLP